jgi:hypothetical protein
MNGFLRLAIAAGRAASCMRGRIGSDLTTVKGEVLSVAIILARMGVVVMVSLHLSCQIFSGV